MLFRSVPSGMVLSTVFSQGGYNQKVGIIFSGLDTGVAARACLIRFSAGEIATLYNQPYHQPSKGHDIQKQCSVSRGINQTTYPVEYILRLDEDVPIRLWLLFLLLYFLFLYFLFFLGSILEIVSFVLCPAFVFPAETHLGRCSGK